MILASGCFDGIHSGHVQYLQAAKAVDPCLPLLVAIASDRYIREVKGREPRWSLNDRIEALAALRVVEDVVVHDVPSVAPIIAARKPLWFVKGADWRDKLPADVRAICKTLNCEIVFTSTERVHGSHVLHA